MEKTVIFSLPWSTQLATTLAAKLKIEIGIAEVRDFPDGDSYVRIDSDVQNKIVILICALDHANCKILPLLFMAQTLKEFMLFLLIRLMKISCKVVRSKLLLVIQLRMPLIK